MIYLTIIFFSLFFGSLSFTVEALRNISFLIAIIYSLTYIYICFRKWIQVSLVLISLTYFTSRLVFIFLYFTSTAFQTRFGDGRNYHIPRAINLYEYESYLDFLKDPKNFNGQFTQFLLNFYHRLLTFFNINIDFNNVDYGSVEFVAFLVNTLFIFIAGLLLIKFNRNISGFVCSKTDQKILLLFLFNPFVYFFSIEPIKEPLLILLISIFLISSSFKNISKSIIYMIVAVVFTFIERFYMALILILLFPFIQGSLGFNKYVLGSLLILTFIFFNYFYSLNDLYNMYGAWQNRVIDNDWSSVSNYSLPFNILRLFFSPLPFRYFFGGGFFINLTGFTSIIYTLMIGKSFIKLILNPNKIEYLDRYILINSIIFVTALPFNPTIKFTMFSVILPIYFASNNYNKNPKREISSGSY